MEITTQPRVILPDPEILAILRLFLERYEALELEDRKLYRPLIAALVNPPMIVDGGKFSSEEFERLTGI